MTCCPNIKQSEAKQCYVQAILCPFFYLHVSEQTCFNAEGMLQSAVSGGRTRYHFSCM